MFNGVIVNLDNGGVINSKGYFQKDDYLRSSDCFINQEEIKIAYDYVIKNFEKQKSFNKDCFSYQLKHIVEKETSSYVSNGALIIAMSLAGFEFNENSDEVNVHFNIKFKKK